MIASKGDTKMSWRRAKSTGWAAFNLQQRQKDVLEAQAGDESFPSLPSTVESEISSGNNHRLVKPFSSVILPSVDYAANNNNNNNKPSAVPPSWGTRKLECTQSSPPIFTVTVFSRPSTPDYPATVGNIKKNKPSEVCSSYGPRSFDISRENKSGQIFRQLKELYSWADESLIEDIMVAAGNEFDKASSFLKAMVSEESLEKDKDNKVGKFSPVQNDMHGKRDASLGMISEPSMTGSVRDSCVGDKNENLLDGCMDINTMLGQLTCVPIEPEWEEDDLYLSCRKDAIKMMRAATRHSKAASNSYLRGDHFSAQQLSLKAREEWVAAERLNAKAAREILSMRNENNGIWRIDLHGLHAAEAIEALQERLHMIETQIFFKGSSHSVHPNNFSTKAEALQDSSLGGCINLERSDEQAILGQKPIWLEVITGIGNHSRGGAALPTVVKTFLADNRYRFDEARPGVIVVRPKIRHT